MVGVERGGERVKEEGRGGETMYTTLTLYRETITHALMLSCPRRTPSHLTDNKKYMYQESSCMYLCKVHIVILSVPMYCPLSCLFPLSHRKFS